MTEITVNQVSVLSNEIRKGDHIRLKNGFHAVIMDNIRGNIRMAEVSGFYTEIGSIYVWDIQYVIKNGRAIPIRLTDKQIKSMHIIRAAGF